MNPASTMSARSDRVLIISVRGLFSRKCSGKKAWKTIATTELRDELVHLAERHYEVVEALCTRDPEIAARSMEQHILELMDELAHRKPYTVNASS